jgi:hypothetical protein
MSASRDVLLRCAEAWELASQGLLLAAGWMPTAHIGGPWRDTTTDRLLAEHQALDEARRAFERDAEMRHHAKALDSLEESLLRAAGWWISASVGGLLWRSPDGGQHSRAEGAAIVRRQLMEVSPC